MIGNATIQTHRARPPQRRPPDDDSHPVMVPRNDKPLAPMARERVRRLREHLIGFSQHLPEARHLERIVSRLRPPPTGFRTAVATSACSLCRGHCCRNGDDDAFLNDDRTLVCIRLYNPRATNGALLRMYLSRVPNVSADDARIARYHRASATTGGPPPDP